MSSSALFLPMSSSLDKPSFFAANRNLVIAGSVLLFHAFAIWALQAGLLMRAVEIIVPVEVLAQIVEEKVELPTPKADPAPPVLTPTPPTPVKQDLARPTPATQTAPPIFTVNEPAPEAVAFVASAPQPPAPIAPVSVPVVAAPAPVLPAKATAPTCVEDYISQPKPPYPRLSRNLGEQGTSTIRVLFSPSGSPIKAELISSSGFERLDKAALDGVKFWRFISCRNVAAATDHWESALVRFALE